MDKLSLLTSDSQDTGWKGILATKIITGLLEENSKLGRQGSGTPTGLAAGPSPTLWASWLCSEWTRGRTVTQLYRHIIVTHTIRVRAAWYGYFLNASSGLLMFNAGPTWQGQLSHTVLAFQASSFKNNNYYTSHWWCFCIILLQRLQQQCMVVNFAGTNTVNNLALQLQNLVCTCWLCASPAHALIF